MGNDFRITAHRGEVLGLPSLAAVTDLDIAPDVVATVHPSSVLRGPPEDRERAFDSLADDLRVVAGLMGVT
jgi:DNA polymerase